MGKRALVVVACAVVAGVAGVSGAALAGARTPFVVALWSDPSTDPRYPHQTAVEPSLAVGRGTLVGVYQVGRSATEGAAGIAWSTTTDGGRHWTSGVLAPTTRRGLTPETAVGVNDPVVAYDAVHGTWIAVSIAKFANGSRTLQAYQSPDGVHWSQPIEVTRGVLDKDWITCDDGTHSAYRGRCYVTFTREDVQRLGVRSTADAGLTWSSETPLAAPLGEPTGAVPVVRPDGSVVVVFRQGGSRLPGQPPQSAPPPWTLSAVASRDGGRTFSSPVRVALLRPYFTPHTRALSAAIPSVVADPQGTLYAVWATCRFRKRCVGNDIALSVSRDGSRWSRPRRVPLGGRGDHVVPGLASALGSAGHVRLGLSYYVIPSDACSPSRCRIVPFFASSARGARRWRSQIRVYRASRLSWLVQAPPGQAFIGDYTSTVFAGSVAWSAFGVASAPSHGALHHMIAVARIGPRHLAR